MQTCSRCKAKCADTEAICSACGADLRRESEVAVALARLQANPRVLRIRLTVHEDACPACRQWEATYEKASVPSLPVQGCSHASGCRCFYEPALSEIYP
jgi:hypothetical protein